VCLTRGRLDRQMAAGRPRDATAALALRAAQLTHPRTRKQIARHLRGTVEYVDRLGSRRGFSTVVIERRAVADGRMPILRLAERLEDTTPASPKGVALARVLLTDGLGPLFNRHSEQSVAEAVCVIEDALDANAHRWGFDAVPLSSHLPGGSDPPARSSDARRLG
jgi:hypothetical protein